jgi:hypothetical protein
MGFDTLPVFRQSHGLELRGERDPVTDHHTAGFEHEIPGQPEVLAADRARHGEADALVASVIDDHLGARHVEHNPACDAADREIAGDLVVVEVMPLDLAGVERDRWMALDIEKQRVVEDPIVHLEEFVLATRCLRSAGRELGSRICALYREVAKRVDEAIVEGRTQLPKHRTQAAAVRTQEVLVPNDNDRIVMQDSTNVIALRVDVAP